MKPGDRVRMTEALKARMRGSCGVAGKHLGPFDSGPERPDPEDTGGDCWGCSSAHIEEFENCIGIAVGPIDSNKVPLGHPDYDPSKVWPEWDVRWIPSGLKYGYLPEDLEIVTD
jgi:hypothetical protein